MALLKSHGPRLSLAKQTTAPPPPKRVDDFYRSEAWMKLRSSLIRQRGRKCERCGKAHDDDGSPVKLIGDHIRERRDGGADLDPSNVMLLCLPCHNAKTAKARGNRWSRRG